MTKKTFVFVLLLFGFFSLVGCGKTQAPTTTKAPATTTAKPSTQAPTTTQKPTTQAPITTTMPEITTTVHTHEYGTIVAQVDPTCTTDGVLAHYVCSGCGMVFDSDKNETTIEELKIPALNHIFSTSWTIDKDIHYHVCSRCGAHDEDVSHSLVHHERVDATHTNNGIEEYYECSVCGGMFSDDACNNQINSPVVINAKGHDASLTYHERVDATCEVSGIEGYYSCSCGKLFSDPNAQNEIETPIVINAKGHKDLTLHNRVNPTCEETGVELYYSCSCGKLFSDSAAQNEIEIPIILNATGHVDLKHYESVEATCEANGCVEYYECLVCHKKFSDSAAQNEITAIIINAKGHGHLTHYDRVEATCEVAGHIEHYECDDCHKYFSDSAAQNKLSTVIIYPTGHKELTLHNRVNPTCEETGIELYYSCSCGKLFSDPNAQNEIESPIILNATGHVSLKHYDRVNPTCTQSGVEEYYKCDTCGKLFSNSTCSNEINEPVVISPTNHPSFRHVTGYCSTDSSSSGFVDHYVCDDCGVIWLDENRTIIIGNTSDTSNIEIPYSSVTYNLKKVSAVPYYNETHGVSFDTTLEANGSVTFDVFGPQITDTNIKSVSIYVRNNTTYSVTMHIYDYTKAKRYLTTTPHASNGWLKYTFSVEDYNSLSYEGKYGLSIIVNSGATGDNGLFSITRLEFNSATEEEIALADTKINQINIIDDVLADGYIKSYIDGLKLIEEIKEILGSSIPSALTNRDKLISYYSLYENYKVLFDASQQRFAVDGMSSSYISGISIVEQNGLSLNKISIRECQTNVLITTPNFTNSIRGQSHIIFRVYNPTSNKATIGVYDTNYSNDPVYSVAIEAESWGTIIIETSLFTTGRCMYLRLTPEADKSLEGDWLLTSVIHYSGQRRIVYGQGSDHKMTIYKAGWVASTKTNKDDMMVFRANLVGTNTDSTAMEKVPTLDSNLYDYVEFYVYNETGNALTIKTHMDGNNTYYYFEETINPGEWIRMTIDISIWNESRSRATRYFEIYPLNSSDTVTGVLYFSYFCGVLK